MKTYGARNIVKLKDIWALGCAIQQGLEGPTFLVSGVATNLIAKPELNSYKIHLSL